MKDLSDLLTVPLKLEPDNFTFNMWGGSWIPRFKGMETSATTPVGESWEFSGHRDHPSRVFLGGEALSLRDLLKSYAPALLGEAGSRRSNAAAPFLLKFIDPKEDLSVQVHPDDESAKRLDNDCGKAEAWIILEADPDACLYLGFSPEKAAGYASFDLFEEAFLAAIQEANAKGPSLEAKIREAGERLVLPFLNKIPVKAGEVYNVPPGTVHAIGRGVRLFEIQQTSDLTYRVWDWNRPAADKLKEGRVEFRPLHLDRAKKCLNMRAQPPDHYRVPSQALYRDPAGDVREDVLIKEEQGRFAANRISLQKTGLTYRGELKGSLAVLTVTKGRVEVARLGPIKTGHSVLVPAAAESFELIALDSPAEIIKSYLP